MSDIIKPLWISAVIIIIVTVIITIGILIYKNVKPKTSPPPITLEGYNEMSLTNDHNNDVHLYYFENDGNKFYTDINGEKYLGTFTMDSDTIKIVSPSLLKYIQDQIPNFCTKPQEIPVFTETAGQEGYKAQYDLGICGKISLNLI